MLFCISLPNFIEIGAGEGGGGRKGKKE